MRMLSNRLLDSLGRFGGRTACVGMKMEDDDRASDLGVMKRLPGSVLRPAASQQSC